MNTIQYLKDNNFTGFEGIKDLSKALFTKKITVYDDALFEGTDPNRRRLIFSCSKVIRNEGFDRMTMECNGLILETSRCNDIQTWKVLNLPLTTAKSNIKTSEINGYLYQGLYDIYHINDGSILYLYYYDILATEENPNDGWRLSSSRGLDMNSSILNTLSFSEIFNQTLQKQGLDIEEFYNSLNTSSSYCFGIRHPDLHPFMEGRDEPIYKMWFIQSVENVSQLSEKKINRESQWELIPNQKLVTHKIKNMHTIYSNLKDAYNNYVSHGKINYGYILVSRNESITQDSSFIMLESSLLQKIRLLWYNGAYTKFIKDRNYNREDTILLNSFLDASRHSTFLQLFPQFKDKFEVITNMETEMVKHIYDFILAKESESNEPKEVLTESEQLSVELLANKVKKTLTLDFHDQPLLKIRDIIHQNENIDIYYRLYQGLRV